MNLRLFTSILLSFVLFGVSAQVVWTEGTSWEVEYRSSGDTRIFFLDEATMIEDVVYYPLLEERQSKVDTLAFVRSEHGDSLVYARRERASLEHLVYDFSKPFAYGDTIIYGDEFGEIFKEYVEPESPELVYYHDILEEGDSLPAWRGIIYLIGYIEGPLELFIEYAYGPVNPDDPDELGGTDSPTGEGDSGGNKPKTTNVSHVLFKTKGRPQSSITTVELEIICLDDDPLHGYTLEGIQAMQLGKGRLFIYRGRKYLLLDR